MQKYINKLFKENPNITEAEKDDTIPDLLAVIFSAAVLNKVQDITQKSQEALLNKIKLKYSYFAHNPEYDEKDPIGSNHLTEKGLKAIGIPEVIIHDCFLDDKKHGINVKHIVSTISPLAPTRTIEQTSPLVLDTKKETKIINMS